MPIYTYRREDGTTFDIRQTFLDDPLENCPTTGQAVARVIQPAGIIFKGSGFYVNDSSQANSPASKNGKDSESPKSEAKPESKAKAQKGSSAEAKTAAAEHQQTKSAAK